jgi:Fic family protein
MQLKAIETKVVLEGITVGGKALREHFEAINHRNAIYYVEDIIRKDEPFPEWQIRNIHQLILKNIDDENAGRYRQQNVLISGSTTTPLTIRYSMTKWLSESIGTTQRHIRFIPLNVRLKCMQIL